MKRILAWGSFMGQLLASAIVQSSGFRITPGHRGANKRPVYRNAYYSSSRPSAKRWWHDLEQPGQCARLQAAKDKRQRRACKLHNIHARASSNPAHRTDYEFLPSGRLVGTTVPASLFPTYVAK